MRHPRCQKTCSVPESPPVPFSPLQSSSNAYGVLYAWKDYNDTLYITVSLNATGFGALTAGRSGQYLVALPPLVGNGPSGQCWWRWWEDSSINTGCPRRPPAQGEGQAGTKNYHQAISDLLTEPIDKRLSVN